MENFTKIKNKIYTDIADICADHGICDNDIAYFVTKGDPNTWELCGAFTGKFGSMTISKLNIRDYGETIVRYLVG